MSREIRFRAYDKENKIYYYNVEHAYDYTVGDPLIPADCFGDLLDNDDYIIEQDTGLKDKNGNKIYEGDIVRNIEGINETAVCIWDESNAEFDFRLKGGGLTRDNVKSWLEMYEVIGNINENPELLGGK